MRGRRMGWELRGGRGYLYRNRRGQRPANKTPPPPTRPGSGGPAPARPTPWGFLPRPVRPRPPPPRPAGPPVPGSRAPGAARAAVRGGRGPAAPAPPAGFTAVFNGKDFTGLRGYKQDFSPAAVAKMSAEDRDKWYAE